MGIQCTIYEDEVVEYVPDFQDNRDQPDGEQLYVEILPATASDLRRMEESFGKVGKGTLNITKRYNAKRDKTILKYVRGIYGLSFRRVKNDEETTEHITTAEQMLKEGALIEPLIEDIFEAIKDQSQLSKGLRKKSD